jgi:RNA recognition motif-containing protein
MEVDIMAGQYFVSPTHKSDGISVFVGNLSLDMTETELTQEFAPYGEIMSTTIMNDRYIGSGQPRGYGFVRMAVRAQGEAAIFDLNGKMWHNRAVTVLEAMSLSPIKSSTRPIGHYRHRN